LSKTYFSTTLDISTIHETRDFLTFADEWFINLTNGSICMHYSISGWNDYTLIVLVKKPIKACN